jgi:hypothetical protein
MTAIPTMMRAVAIDRFGGPDVYRGCRRLGRRHPGRVGQRGSRRVPRPPRPSATLKPPAISASLASVMSLRARSSGGLAVMWSRIDFSSISPSSFVNAWMHSCSPLVIGKSCGSIMSRPFAFAVASPRSSRS